MSFQLPNFDRYRAYKDLATSAKITEVETPKPLYGTLPNLGTAKWRVTVGDAPTATNGIGSCFFVCMRGFAHSNDHKINVVPVLGSAHVDSLYPIN